MSDVVKLEQQNHVGIITLNDPEKRNAMTMAMLDGIAEVTNEVAGNPEIRVVVLTGAGKSFCAGADFQTLPKLQQQTGLPGLQGQRAAIRQLYEAFLKIDALPIPTVAAINGAAVGGGLGIALLCDVRVIAADAKIGANFARLGIHPGLGISHFLVQAIGYEQAARHLFTGALINGHLAHEIGLCSELVETREQTLERALQIADGFAASAPLAVTAIKRTIRMTLRRNLAEILEIESSAQAMLSQTEDAREGVTAMLQKREPDFKGK